MQTSIILGSEAAATKNRIKKIVMQEGYRVIAETDDGLKLLRLCRNLHPNVVIVENMLKGMSGLEIFKIIAEDNLAPVLLIAQQWQREFINEVKEHWFFSFIVKPFDDLQLLYTLEQSMVNFQHYGNLKKEMEQLRERLESRKVIEQAKALLMEKSGLSEKEAYKKIQKQSMDKCKSMKEIAEAIITVYE